MCKYWNEKFTKEGKLMINKQKKMVNIINCFIN